jgi:uracil-DNA glycosylase family 4
MLRANLNLVPKPSAEVDQLRSCNRCRLSPFRGENPACTQIVPGTGSLSGKLMILLQNPGETEDKYGLPAIGEAFWLISALAQMAITYEHFWITNTTLCRTPGNRASKQDEINRCSYNLDFIIDRMPNLKLIILLGKDAGLAIEGRDFQLSARLGKLGRVERISQHTHKKRKFLTIALKHPVALAYIRNEVGKAQATAAYLAQLRFVVKVIENLDDIENFKIPLQINIAWNEETAWEIGEQIKNDPKIFRIARDFETLGIKRGHAVPIADAIAYDSDKCLVIPYKQRIDLPKDLHYKVKPRSGKERFEMKWMWKTWHSENFEQEFNRRILRPLCDFRFVKELPEGRKQPAITAWHMIFEQNCVRGADYGYELTGTLEQMQAPHLCSTPFDVMAAMRGVTNVNNMSLEYMLKLCMPLIAYQKDQVSLILGEPKKSKKVAETGFGLLALKPPTGIPIDELKGMAKAAFKRAWGDRETSMLWTDPAFDTDDIRLAKLWSPEAQELLPVVLLERAGFDAIVEYQFCDVWDQVSQDPEEMAIDHVGRFDIESLFNNERSEAVWEEHELTELEME